MERKLRRLREGAKRDEHEDGGIEGAGAQVVTQHQQQRKLGDAGDVPDEHEPRQQEQPAAAGDEQRLQRRPARGGAGMIEADQQKGGDGCEFPVDEQHEEAVRHHQP